MRFLAIALLFAPCAVFAAGEPAASPRVVDAHLRRDAVIPTELADYELATLDVTKEAVFHVGDQTIIGRIPLLVYVPISRPGRAVARDRLLEARAILVQAASGERVSAGDLAAIRDLLEQAIRDLDAPAAKPSQGAPTTP